MSWLWIWRGLVDNPAFDHVNTVKRLSNRLYKRLGIIAFTFSRVYKDGSRCELWSEMDAFTHTFVKAQSIDRVYTPPLFNNLTFAIYDIVTESFPSPVRNKISKQLRMLEDSFELSNCIVLIDYHDEYTEYCMFYTPKKDTQAINRYLNNLEYLKSFRRYFRHMAKDSIYEASADKIVKPWRAINNDSSLLKMDMAKQIITTSGSSISSVSEVKKIFTGVGNKQLVANTDSSVRLTAREEEVSSFIVDGSTAKEIAEVLHISPKTVEKHILNINNKFGTNRRAKLISELNRYYDR